jgi:hypothetical protein
MEITEWRNRENEDMGDRSFQLGDEDQQNTCFYIDRHRHEATQKARGKRRHPNQFMG